MFGIHKKIKKKPNKKVSSNKKITKGNAPTSKKTGAKTFKPVKENFKKNKITGHPSLPISESKRQIKAIGFTHDDKEKFGKKYAMKNNIDQTSKKQMYAKIQLEKNKSSVYKTEPKYNNYKISKEDRSAIELIKKGKFKK